MPRVTINDVAAVAGVSIKTVSRVVNQEPNVRDSTRARVEEAITRLSYRPNPSARNLAKKRSSLIGLIYDDPSAYEIPSAGYVIRMQYGALRACRTADYELLIHPCDYRSRSLGSELRTLIEHARPVGIVLAAPLSNVPEIVQAIEGTGTPFVRVSPGTNNVSQPTVRTNDRDISAEMTRYLASLGHRRIAFIKGHSSHTAVGNRFLGYLDGLNESGLPYSTELVEQGDNSFDSGVAAGMRLLKRADPPTAIFAANDDMAAGVIRTAHALGVSVPGRVSVAGCDDVSLARQISPTLTTIRQPLAAMAERATLMLIHGAQNKTETQGTEIVPATLQIRESTGPARP